MSAEQATTHILARLRAPGAECDMATRMAGEISGPVFAQSYELLD
jgi:hypothetical protein